MPKHRFAALSPRFVISSLLAGAMITGLSACSETSKLPISNGMGANPELPAPNSRLLPTVNVAKAVGWPSGLAPTVAEGLKVNPFASNLNHPRWLYVLPNGDVLVAETNAPTRPRNNLDIRSRITSWFFKRAGAAVVSPNRIMLLRDSDGDGMAETRTIFLDNLNSPFGMMLIDHDLYIANTDAVIRFPYEEGETQISAAGTKVASLPAGEINHHWTKNIIASQDGAFLYATVGSNSNVAENGMENEIERAAILEIEVANGRSRVFASGLRNPNGLAWEPTSGKLWTAVNERDELGNDLVPDYITSVSDGGFYGWPYSYYGQHIDDRVKPQRPDLTAKAIAPDYALGSHTASLGIAFSTGNLLGDKYTNGLFIGQHGSWNRKPASGYKVIFVPFNNGQAAGPAEDVLTGFLSSEGEAYGRPVGVALQSTGTLLVADDVGNTIWRVSPASH